MINEITSVGKEFAVVLEDYHAIEAEAVHEGVAFLLDHLPPQMHLLIITRADPPLPLARLRARDELTELRAADLRFTLDEASAYLKQAAGLDLSTADAVALEARTEGWIVGLQMAALSMRGREDVAGFIQSFTGSHRYILDYLAEEVLHRQSERVRSFMVETSVLNRLSGPLCDAVTGETDGQETLEMLESANLFMVPLDDERRWYRYHHLFAEFLRSFLQEAEPSRISELHGRASEWFADNGFAAEAVGQALAAEDFERASRLVEQSAETLLWRDSQRMTVLNWMDSLPKELVRSRPRLCLLHAWTRFTTGQWETVEPLLQRVERALSEADGGDRNGMLGEAAVIRSGIAYESGEMERSIELARRALELLPEDALTVRAVAAFQLGLGRFFVGDLSGASEAYTEAAAISRAAGNVTIALLAIGCQVQLEVVQGRLRAAAEAYRQARQLGTLKAGPPLSPTGLACVQMGEVLREWNDLEAAARITREGIDLCRQQGGMPEHVLEGYVCLARVLQARGDEEGALDAMQQADQLLAELLSRPGDVRPIIAQAMGYRVRWWLTRDDLVAADRWMEQEGLDGDVELDPARVVDHILLPRVLIAHRRYDDALSVLERLEPAEADGRTGPLAEILALRALATQAQGDESRATELLGRALVLAEPEGYLRLFLDEAEPMRRLLRHAITGSVAQEYAGRVLAAFPAPAAPGTGDLLESLNDREMAIVRFMSAGLSNRDIADELYLSVNTVKWHARNIYGKLGVSNRSMAVARARELRIL
jgi:LuxR family maltose regulon positive regulatory protein